MPVYERPLYLHFLDRELGNAAGFRLASDLLEQSVKILLLGTATRFYCGVSLVWENPAVDDQRADLISLLLRTGNLDLVSHHVTQEEFLDTRKTMYRHDPERYPAYFAGQARSALVQTQYKAEGTTESLVRDFEEAIDTGRIPVALGDDARRAAEHAFNVREDRAVTYALFEPELSRRSASPKTRFELRRAISVLYCRHYLAYAGGDLPTGIVGLSYFEQVLPHSFPLADLGVLEACLRQFGLGPLLDEPFAQLAQFWEELAIVRGHDTLAQDELARLIAGLDPGGPTPPLHARRQALKARVRGLAASIPKLMRSPSGVLTAHSALNGMAAVVALARLQLLEHAGTSVSVEATPVVDVLLVTATDSEDIALHEVLSKRFGRRPNVRTVGAMTFEEFGQIGDVAVWHLRCDMGATGPDASTLAIFEAIDLIHPSSIIMLGIAFGIDRERQPIGTVLVARSVYPYKFRASTTRFGRLRLDPRGDPAPASPYLLARFRTATQSASSAEVGVVLSGDALVDNIRFRRAIERLPREKPIGGEMEGYGLYAAASRRQKPWILVKSVCDWADGRKGEDKRVRQHVAGTRCAQFVLDVLQQSKREVFVRAPELSKLSPE